MKPDIGDIPFVVEMKLKLSRLSFGQHEGIGIIDPPSDFAELDTLGDPVFYGRCFFGRNNIGKYPDENFGIKCQGQIFEEARISDDIGCRVFKSDRSDYSFAWVYAEDAACAEIGVFLNPNAFEKLYIARGAVNFQLATSLNEHSRITRDQYKNRTRKPDKIVIEGEPGVISTINKFTLDVGDNEFGNWWFRVRLVSLEFSPDRSPSAPEN